MEPATITGVLLAITRTASQSDLPSLLVNCLERCSSAEKAPIAKSLAEVLKAIPNVTESAASYLSGFIEQLIFPQEEVSDDRLSENAALAAKLVATNPEPFKCLIAEGLNCLGQVISIAQAAHVSSDDGFIISSHDFLDKFTSLCLSPPERVSVEEKDVQITYTRAQAYLKFYEMLLLTTPQMEIWDTTIVEKMMLALLVLLGHSNLSIAFTSGKLLYLLLEALPSQCSREKINGELVGQMVYQRLQDLTAGTTREGHKIYTIWLQWVSTSVCRPTKEVLREDKYWAMLQHGILQGFSAQRKLCLQILNLSINLLVESFQNGHFIWDEKLRKASMQAWSKYATLFEIIVFDTSANQLKDALPEFRRLLTPPTRIHGSWMSVLLALALKNSSTSIQATAYELVLSLGWQQLEFIVEEEMFFTGYFLPYAMIGSQFSISGEHNDQCEHGEKLSKFLTAILKSSPEKFANRLVDTLLAYIIDKHDTIFSPAKIYILLGIVNGLEKRQILGRSQITKVVKIASNKRFSKTRSELATSLCLRLLFSARIENGTDENKGYLRSLYHVLNGNERVFGLQEAKSLSDLILMNLTSEDHKRLVKLDSYIGGTSGEFLSHPSGSTVVNERIGKEGALLCTILTVSDCLDQSVIDSLLQWIGVNAASVHTISSLFDFDYPLIDRLLADGVFKRQVIETLTEYSEALKSTESLVNGLDGKFLSNILSGLYNASQRPHTEIPIGILNRVASEFFRTLWLRQQQLSEHNSLLNLRKRVEALKVCASAANIINESGCTLPLSLNDILSLVGEYLDIAQRDSEGLREGNYMNAEVTKLIEHTLEAVFSLLDITLKFHGLSYDGQKVIDCITRHLRFITNQSLRPVINCVKAVMNLRDAAPKESIANCLVELWDLAEQTRSGSDSQGVYAEFFGLLFDPALREFSNVDEIDRISKEALKFSISRRCIAPALARTLSNLPSDALIHHLNLIVGLINLMQLKEVDYLQEESLCGIMDRLKDSTPGAHYKYYNGDKEIVAQARIYNLLSRLDPSDPADVKFVGDLRQELLQPWQETKNSIQVSAHKKTSQLQSLLVTDRFVGPEDANEFLQKALETLNLETHPRYRFLFEWMVTRVIIRLPKETNRIWKLLDPKERLNPRTQVSLIKIAMMVAHGVSEENKLAYYEKLINTIVPLISNSKVVVRHLAITSVLAIWKNITDLNFSTLTSNPLLQQIREQILNSPFYLETTPIERQQSETIFNPLTNYTLLEIFHGTYLLGGDFIERITKADFLNIDPDRADGVGSTLGDTEKNQSRCFIPLGTDPNVIDKQISPVEYSRTVEKLVTGGSASIITPLQTKSGTWITTEAKSFQGITTTTTSVPGSESQPNDKDKHQDKDILLLASLIQNPTNLGGLSRVSEIFGLSSLIINNLKHLTTKEFTSVSVSSEHWLPIEEVKIEKMRGFIRDKKLQGYTIVGIEQTDESIILGRNSTTTSSKDHPKHNNSNEQKEDGCKLPKKAVLLLGSEREGIPAEFLGEVDLCVEIEQRGETRSLNVQTAAAVVCYEWNRQWRQ